MKTSHVLIKLTGLMPWASLSLVWLHRRVYDLLAGRLMNTTEGGPIWLMPITGLRSAKRPT